MVLVVLLSPSRTVGSLRVHGKYERCTRRSRYASDGRCARCGLDAIRIYARRYRAIRVNVLSVRATLPSVEKENSPPSLAKRAGRKTVIQVQPVPSLGVASSRYAVYAEAITPLLIELSIERKRSRKEEKNGAQICSAISARAYRAAESLQIARIALFICMAVSFFLFFFPSIKR